MMSQRRMVTYYKCQVCGKITYEEKPKVCLACKSKEFKKYRQKERRIITK